MIRWHITTFIFLHINIHHHSDNAKNAQMYKYYICAYTYEYTHIYIYIHAHMCCVALCHVDRIPFGVWWFLQARAEVNVQNSDGDTPLHFACQRRDGTFAEMLLSRGADPWQRHPGWDGVFNEVVNGGSVKKLWMLNSHHSANQTAITVLLNHVEPVFHHSQS